MSSSSSSPPPSSLSTLSLLWLDGGWLWFDADSEAETKPQLQDLLLVPLLIMLIHTLKKLVGQFIAPPLSVTLGIPQRKTKSNQNFKSDATLENLFHSQDRSVETLRLVSGTTSLSVRQIEFWLRRRQKAADLPSKPQLADKFHETTINFVVESFKLLFGVSALWCQKWAWSLRECWIDWPAQPRQLSIRCYYIFQLSACCLNLLTHFSDKRRKDFWQMFIHHIVTFILIFGSWITNTIRIGSVILLLHDVVDPVLQSTKMAAYSKRVTLSTVLFAVFALLWFSTRLLLFPLRVISSCSSERVDVFAAAGVVNERLETLFRIFIACLWVLYILHWIWFYNIVVLITKVAKGENVKDTRSEDEDDGEEEEGGGRTHNEDGRESDGKKGS